MKSKSVKTGLRLNCPAGHVHQPETAYNRRKAKAALRREGY